MGKTYGLEHFGGASQNQAEGPEPHCPYCLVRGLEDLLGGSKICSGARRFARGVEDLRADALYGATLNETNKTKRRGAWVGPSALAPSYFATSALLLLLPPGEGGTVALRGEGEGGIARNVHVRTSVTSSGPGAFLWSYLLSRISSIRAFRPFALQIAHFFRSRMTSVRIAGTRVRAFLPFAHFFRPHISCAHRIPLGAFLPFIANASVSLPTLRFSYVPALATISTELSGFVASIEYALSVGSLRVLIGSAKERIPISWSSG